MQDEPAASYHSQPRDPDDHAGADGRDLILAAFTQLGGSLSGDGAAHWKIPLARQKENLYQWADGLGLLLATDGLPWLSEFIAETLAAGHRVSVVRTVSTVECRDGNEPRENS